MYVHFISDLSTELYSPYLFEGHVSKDDRCGISETEEIILILAGEMGDLFDDCCSATIRIACKKYDHIIWLPELNQDDDINKLKEKWREEPLVTILYHDTCTRYGMTFLATTLYPSLKSKEAPGEYFQKERDWIKERLEELGGYKVIVITNFLPGRGRPHKIYQGNQLDYLRHVCNDLVVSPIVYWFYGHSTHESSLDFQGVTLMTHPRGYHFQHNHFKPKLAIPFLQR
jgi:hypothetical protein